MNTELLREDERPEGELWGQRLIELLRQRLIEEREKSLFWKEEARRYCQNSDYWTARVENAEAELAKALRREQALLRLGAGAAP